MAFADPALAEAVCDRLSRGAIDIPLNRAADGTLQGHFSLDINQGQNFEGNQTYSVYLFSGEQLGAVPKVELP